MPVTASAPVPNNGLGQHRQPEVNNLPHFSPQLFPLERQMLSFYRAGEIDLFENLDIVHMRLLLAVERREADRHGGLKSSERDVALDPFPSSFPQHNQFVSLLCSVLKLT